MKSPSEPTYQLNVRIGHTLDRRLKQRAEYDKRARSVIVLAAIEHELNQLDVEDPIK